MFYKSNSIIKIEGIIIKFKSIENPTNEEAYQIIQEGFDKKSMLIILSKCHVEYEGRARSILESGDRLILIKKDGTFAIHQELNLDPVNWQAPGCKNKVSLSEEGIILTSKKMKPNEEIKVFLDEIYNVISDFTTCSHAHINYCRTIGFSALYLCACSALKQDRDVITYEDVIKGHLALFKLFQTDIRPLVKRGYANYRGFYYKNKKAGYPKRILWADYYSTEK